jgi:hypothetical protein
MNAPGTGSEASGRPESISTGDFAGWRERLLAAIQLRALVSPRVQRALLGVAAVFLLVGLALSINAHPEVLAQTYWPYLLIVVAANFPLGLALVVVEFMVSARLIRKTISIRYALFTVICGSAANMLPLPGAFMARMAGLKSVGARYRDGAYATLLTNLVWLALSFLWSGAWLASIEAGPLSLLSLTLGLLLCGLCLLLAKWLNAGALNILILFAARLALIANQSVRLLLCLLAIHLTADYAQASVLSLSGVIGSAVSLVPAGFGIREGAAAALGPIIGLNAAAGFLAVFVNRILDLVVLAPLAALLGWRGKRAEPMGGDQEGVLPTQ